MASPDLVEYSLCTRASTCSLAFSLNAATLELLTLSSLLQDVKGPPTVVGDEGMSALVSLRDVGRQLQAPAIDVRAAWLAEL